MFGSFWSEILAQFSHNSALYRYLKQKRATKLDLTQHNSIYLYDVFALHNLKIKALKDYHFYNNELYTHFISHFKTSAEELEQLRAVINPIFETQIYTQYQVDLSMLSGFSNSKSPLQEFQTIDAFVEKQCPSYISEISAQRLEAMLAHREIRIIHSPGTSTDEFVVFAWLEKLFIANTGGSHHLAAAHYIAKRLNYPVPLIANLRCYVLNEHYFKIFHQHYVAFVLPRAELDDAIQYFEHSNIRFIKLVERHKELEIFFFARSTDNHKIISIFEEKYRSLNEMISWCVAKQAHNVVLQQILSKNSCL
ncbi:hypothetical protein D9K79_13020 [Acinetobacter cumulans]|uniref:Uncharacterized protein n=1 Tax=Acinetobacter cumulans TaxID=2136182 RepID=A0ABX9U550_9GAMM|nr:DUF6685 family protein [Acinetobacter cumulans]RLL41259.1 hypothetical protein D9K79_13020 [Acinetobacter cumulans]